jgi:N4-gp56 family major capsid protein
MATTAFDGLSDAQVRQWELETWQAGRNESFFFANGFVANNDYGQNYPVHRVTKFSRTQRGLECVMQLVLDLVGDGVVGDNKLDGAEEQLVNDAQTIQIDQLRNGCRSRGKLSEQATLIEFRAKAKQKLGYWLGDKLDELGFLVASGRALTLTVAGATRGASQLPQLRFASDITAASTNRIIHAGTATSEATLTTSDKMTWSLITRAKALAQRKLVKPIRDRGKPYYAMVLSTEQMRDLRTDPTYLTIQRTASERGSKNPLFSAAEIVAEGVVLHSHNRVYSTLDATSGSGKWGAANTVNGAQALLFGAGALGFASPYPSQAGELDNTDYQNKQGVSFGRMMGYKKPQFKSIPDANAREDFGVISVKTAAGATI